MSIRIVWDMQSSDCRQSCSGEETLQIFQNAKAFTQQEVDDKIMPMLMHEYLEPKFGCVLICIQIQYDVGVGVPEALAFRPRPSARVCSVHKGHV